MQRFPQPSSFPRPPPTANEPPSTAIQLSFRFFQLHLSIPHPLPLSHTLLSVHLSLSCDRPASSCTLWPVPVVLDCQSHRLHRGREGIDEDETPIHAVSRLDLGPWLSFNLLHEDW